MYPQQRDTGVYECQVSSEASRVVKNESGRLEGWQRFKRGKNLISLTIVSREFIGKKK